MPVKKYGRALINVSYGDGKSFNVGQTKIDAVLSAKAEIEEAVA